MTKQYKLYMYNIIDMNLFEKEWFHYSVSYESLFVYQTRNLKKISNFEWSH